MIIIFLVFKREKMDKFSEHLHSVDSSNAAFIESDYSQTRLRDFTLSLEEDGLLYVGERKYKQLRDDEIFQMTAAKGNRFFPALRKNGQVFFYDPTRIQARGKNLEVTSSWKELILIGDLGTYDISEDPRSLDEILSLQTTDLMIYPCRWIPRKR